MLVRPTYLALCELFAISRWWRGVGDLSDQECSRRFCDSIYKDTQQRDLQKYVESNTKTEKESLAVAKPQALLLFVETNPGEVWFELS